MYSAILVLLFAAILKTNCEDANYFPDDFEFGVATASHQIEGGWNADGKGENIWDVASHISPNWTKDSQSGDIACDSYNLWRQDVAMVKDLGVNYYRFSLSWSRLLPTGHSNFVNPHGVRYYNSLINELLKNDIEPIVTLYHWDLPQPLQNLGGWANLDMADCFENYANTAFKLFGDRVKKWVTINEPFEVCQGGYGVGRRAPFIKESGIADYMCGKTILIAHAKAYRNYQKNFKASQNGKLGLSVSAFWFEPKTELLVDVVAAERVRQMNIGWWLHPMLSKTGDYPQIMKEQIANISLSENYTKSRLPELSVDEIELIRGSYDFLGLNHYTTKLVSHVNISAEAPTSMAKDVSVLLEANPEWPKTVASWMNPVPWGFRKLLNWLKNEYDNPLIYITENGFGDSGGLMDQERINFYKEYLQALLEAIHLDRCNIKMYLAWSLMDNLEWDDGYTIKFGLYQVNFTDPSRTRTIKASGNYYKSVVQTRKLNND